MWGPSLQPERTTFDLCQQRRFAHSAPHHGYILVVHDGEEPSSHIRARLPQIGLSDRSYERILREIVRMVVGSGQRSRVTAQLRDLAFSEAVEWVTLCRRNLNK
jgi:hypothetical protein